MNTYEAYTSNQNSIYHQSDTNLNFPEHFHTNIEFCHVFDGELEVKLNGKQYLLKKDDNILILPRQNHSFVTNNYSKSYLCVFSSDFVMAFYGKMQNTKQSYAFKNPVFGNITAQEIEAFMCSNCLYFQKSFFYKLCSYACQNGLQSMEDDANFTIDKRIIEFITLNFSQNITIKSLSRQFGYNEHYLSSFFQKTFDCGFNTYLNNIRLNHALKILIETTKNITQISIDCGFGSIRNFNRAFLKKFNTTPKKYRQNI